MGNRTRVKVVKNKLAAPFREAEFDIMYGQGISYEGDVLDLGAELNIVDKSGSWYSYGDARLGQGRENSKQYLRDNPETAAEIERAIREHYGLPIPPHAQIGAQIGAKTEAKGEEAEEKGA